MNEIFRKLETWRGYRNIPRFNKNVYVADILEELAEYLRAKTEYDKIDALCDIAVFSINTALVVEDDILEANEFYTTSINEIMRMIVEIKTRLDTEYIIDITNIAFSIMYQMGYDYKMCMLETIKEISSREQDPLQKQEWLLNGASGKWKKDTSDEAKAKWYKADYERCRVN